MCSPDLLQRLAIRWCPPNPVAVLSKPVYLYEQAIEETETALDLVEREQARLVARLARHFDALRPEEIASPLCAPGELQPAVRALAAECQVFIDRLLSQPQSHDTLERLVGVRSRNELLMQLHDGCSALSGLLAQDFAEPEARSLRHSVLEGLCSVLMVFEDTLADREEIGRAHV